MPEGYLLATKFSYLCISLDWSIILVCSSWLMLPERAPILNFSLGSKIWPLEMMDYGIKA